MKHLVRTALGLKNLADIQKTFTQVVDDLKDLQTRNEMSMEDNSVKINELLEKNDTLGQEKAKAARFQENLEKLLS